jgi:hypothetical protein
VLGTSLLGAGVVTLLGAVCYRARLAWQEGRQGTGDGRSYLLRLSPFVLTAVCGTALCFAKVDGQPVPLVRPFDELGFCDGDAALFFACQKPDGNLKMAGSVTG